MAFMSGAELRKHPCPNCGRRGLHHPNHPHAFGYKDTDRVRCRFCKKTFRIREQP